MNVCMNRQMILWMEWINDIHKTIPLVRTHRICMSSFMLYTSHWLSISVGFRGGIVAECCLTETYEVFFGLKSYHCEACRSSLSVWVYFKNPGFLSHSKNIHLTVHYSLLICKILCNEYVENDEIKILIKQTGLSWSVHCLQPNLN